jgi:heme exporter protein A
MNELIAEGVGQRFGQRVLFRRLDLTASGGETLAVTGSNGSGKSTLVRILAGVQTPTRGRVVLRLEGADVPDDERPFRVGLVAPYLNVYDGFSPRENLEFIARARRLPAAGERIRATLERVALADRSDDYVGTFSSGMKQRMRFAAALLADPPVVLLDEPTSNLDEAGIRTVADIVRACIEDGKVVVVATNDAAEAAACDRTLCVTDFR